MAYQGGKLPDGTPLNVAVYKAYRNAGLSHNQAMAITAETGRENSFRADIAFGNHTDPAPNTKGGKIRNLGMLSWNQGRDKLLEGFLVNRGVMKNGVMQKSQANLNAQAEFSVREMKSNRYAPKLKNFWQNPNGSPESFAKELGQNYIVWAYGQNTIRGKTPGTRQPFNWKAEDNRRRSYLAPLGSMLGDKTNYSAQQGSQSQQQAFSRPARRPLSELIAANAPPPEPFKLPQRRPLSELLGQNNQAEAFSLPERKPLSELLAQQQQQQPITNSSEAPQLQAPSLELSEPAFSLPERRPLSELLAANNTAEQPNEMPELEPQEWQN